MTHATLSTLPPELLLEIAEALGPSLSSLNALVRTSRGFAQVLSAMLYQRGTVTRDRITRRTVLQWAAATGRDTLLVNLLARGADVNARDNRGLSPLHSAVLCGSAGTVERLLESGAKVQRRTKHGWSALDLAAIIGHSGVAALLVSHGADMAAPTRAGLEKTPLHYAALHGHSAVVELFLNRGVDPGVTDKVGLTVTKSAAAAGWLLPYEEMGMLLVGTPEAARAVVESFHIVQLGSIVEMENSMDRRQIRYMLGMEERGASFDPGVKRNHLIRDGGRRRWTSGK